MMKEARELQRSREEAVIGSMIMPGGAGLGDLYYAHYNLRHRQQEPADRSVGLGWTPSEDAAMVRASVEVTISNYLDVEAPGNEIAPSASEFSVETETAFSDSGSSAIKSAGTLSTAASSDCQISNKPKFSWAQRYAISVAANPKRHLYTTLVVCAILTLAAVVGAVVTGQTIDARALWLTRGTLISSRALQVHHLKKRNEDLNKVDGQRVDINSPPSSDIVCSGGWYGSSFMTEGEQLNLVTAWKTRDDSKNALDSEALYQMCVNEEHVLQTMEENDLCYKCPIEGGRQERCIQPYSLVAAARFYLQGLSSSAWALDLSPDIYLAPSLSCEDLRAEWTTAVQARFTNDLLDCTNSLLEQYELKESGTDSAKCSLPDAHMVASLVDVKFARSGGRVEYTSSIYASKQDTASLDELYRLDKSGAFAQERDTLRGVYEVGVQPLWQHPDGGFYERNFLSAMAIDVALAAAGCIAAGSFIFWHTKSLYLTLFGLLQITLALPISWVLYRFVLGLESFPTVNVAGFFVAFSLGADDVFVMVDKWKSSRNIMPYAPTRDVATVSLPSAISATLVTSFTTSVAFFATNSSNVTCIKLFGTFSGLVVVVDYVLSVLLLSPVLCLYDSIVMKGSPSLFVSIQKPRAVEENADIKQDEVTVKMQRNFRDLILRNYIKFLYSFRWPTLFVSFSTMIACSFVASAFKTPEKEPFPALLSKANPYESHSNFVTNLVAFPLQLAINPRWAGKAVFGVQAIDNGNKLDPSRNLTGSLVYDDDFEAANNQLYLLEFCEEIKKPIEEDYNCVLQEFDSWLQLQSQSSSPDDQYIDYCNKGASIPIDADTFDQCLIAFSELTNSNAISHDGEKVKAITINTRVDSSPWSIRSEIGEEWRQIEDWSVAERSKAPEGANNFFISSDSFWYLDALNNITTSALKSFYIVMSCAALVILLSSRSLTISLFSSISILYVLVATTASLAGLGWRLGPFESVLFAILVGLGSDFILHFAHAYSMIPGEANKQVRMKHAILHMGPSVLGSAATTLSTAVIMQFCQAVTNKKFSTMVIMTMIHSLIGSFLIFSVLCSCFGPAEPTKRFDAIKNKVVSRLHKRKEIQTRSEGDLPKSIEIAIDANVNNRSSFRPKHWMIVLFYLVAVIASLCISFGAASFVKASQEPQIVESAFAADDPVLVVDGDEDGDDGIFGEMMLKFTDAVAKSSMSDEMAPIVLKLFETMKEVTVKLLPMLLGWEKHLMLTMTIDIMEVVSESFNEGDFDFTLMLEMFERTKEFIVRLHTTTAAFMTGIREQEFQEIMFKWESAVVGYLGLFNDCAKDITIGAGFTDESVDIGLLELLRESCHGSLMQSSLATATAKGSKLELQDVKDAFTAIEEVVKRPLPQPSYPEGKRWLCIFSNVAEGQDDCHGLLDLDRGDHSALMLHDDTETYPLSYYSLRPDGNPFDPNYGPGLDSNPFKSDLRVNYYQDVYSHSTYPYRYCKSIDTQQYAKFVNELDKDWFWTGFFNCASFASKVFGRVTGIHVASGDWAALGASPCKVGKAIIELNNSTGHLAPDFPPE